VIKKTAEDTEYAEDSGVLEKSLEVKGWREMPAFRLSAV